MATTKTLTPTNQNITLSAFTEKPDNRINVTNDEKLADAVNALNGNLSNIGKSSQFDVTAGNNVTITSQRNCSLNGNTTQKLVSIMFTTSADIDNGILFNGFYAVGAPNSIIPIYLVSSAETKVYSMRLSGNGQANANGSLPAGNYCASGVYI